MSDLFTIALVSMQQDMQRVDRVASNLANVSTPGYRREIAAAHPFARLVGADVVADPAVDAADGPGLGAPGPLGVLSDTRPGTVKVTGNALDVAITGDGFLEVSTDAGLAYTRQGDLRLDAQGRLVTAQGHPVMGRDGEIRLATPTPVIDASGAITEPDAAPGSAMAPGSAVAHLKVVRFQDARSLVRLGDGLFAAGQGMTVLDAGHGQVRQGALENPNVTSTQEMVALMQAMRHFESMQRAVQGYDEMLGLALRKLGDLS